MEPGTGFDMAFLIGMVIVFVRIVLAVLFRENMARGDHENVRTGNPKTTTRNGMIYALIGSFPGHSEPAATGVQVLRFFLFSWFCVIRPGEPGCISQKRFAGIIPASRRNATDMSAISRAAGPLPRRNGRT